MMRIKIAFYLVVLAVFVSSFPIPLSLGEAPPDHPYVEGTMYDTKKPKDSVAMINGQPYKVGDTVGEYVVAEIFANGVKLKKASTAEEISLVVGADQTRFSPKDYENNGGSSTPGIGKLFSGLMGKKGASDVGLRPALQSLRKALMEYRSEVGRFPENLAVLAQEGRVNPHVVEGVGNYQFSYERLGQTFTLYAEPRWPSSEEYYYYMDDIGRLRARKGHRADQKSELVKF